MKTTSMRNINYLFLILFLFSCSHKEEEVQEVQIPIPAPLPKKLGQFEFENAELDKGKILDGTKLTYQFPFKNVGEYPLFISNCKSSCGPCKWPKNSIPPQGKGMIEISMNTKHRRGKMNKVATLTANTNPVNTFLKMKAEVMDVEERNE